MQRAILLVMVLFLTGCGTVKFPILNSAKPPDQIYSYRQTISTEPRVVQTNEKGESVVFTAQQQTVEVGYDQREKPLTGWAWFCTQLAKFGLLAIIALVIALFVAPGATIMWLFKKKSEAENALKQTVRGIDNAGGVEKNAELRQSLAASQDAKTKAIIDDIQQPGK